MIKCLKVGRRIVTLALSAALIMGEASVSFAAPKISLVPAIEVTEDSEVTGDYTPGKVTNVGFKTYLTSDVINQNLLSWDAVQGATQYQLRVTDLQGKEYANVLVYDRETKKYTEAYYNSISSLTFTFGSSTAEQVEKKNGSYGYVYDNEGNNIYMKAGTKHNVQVRAVRYYKAKYTYGPWSDPVSYTTPAKNSDKISDVRIEQGVDGRDRLRYTSTSSVEMEVKDAAGNLYYLNRYIDTNPETGKDNEILKYLTLSSGKNNSYNFNDYILYAFDKTADGKSFEIKKDANGNPLYAFEPGKTFTVRLRAFYNDEKGKKHEGEWSAPLSVKLSDLAKPGKVKNLDINNSYTEVSWSSIPSAYGYKYEIKDSEGNYYITDYIDNTSSTVVYLSNLYQAKYNPDNDSYTIIYDENEKKIKANKPGMKYTVKVRAYNRSYKYDFEKGLYPRQYGEWSDVFTFTLPKGKSFDISTLKGRGLHYTVNNQKLEWNAVEDETGLKNIKYEIELKDGLGRNYSLLDTDGNGVQSLTNIITDSNSLSSIYTYVKIDDVYEAVKKSNGYVISSFIQGMKYTARVRAIADVEQIDGTYVTKQGEWSDKYEFTVPESDKSSGINAVPAKVTGLWIDEVPEKDGYQYYPYLEWNEIENASAYEIEVKDAAGNLFVPSGYIVDGKYIPQYKSVSSEHRLKLSDLGTLISYSKKDGESIKTLRNAAGVAIHPLMAGQTYTFRVRARNSYYEYKSDHVTTPTIVHEGEWSDPITYTAVDKNLKVTGLKYVKSDDDYYYFDFNADNGYSELYYQISSDPNFTDGTIINSWSSVTVRSIKDSNYKFTIYKSSFKPSRKYYVRVVNSAYGTPSNIASEYGKAAYDSVLSTGAITSFTTEPEEEKEPKNITGLKLYDESNNYFYFRFDATLLNDDYDRYDVQVNNVPDDNDNWWNYSTANSSSSSKYDFSLYKSNLPEGDIYVRAVAYRMVKDKETGEDVKKYGKPSNVVKVSKILRTTSSIGSISLEETDSSYIFKFTGDVRKNENIEASFSTSSTFDNNYKNDIYSFTRSSTPDVNKIVSISKSEFRPRKTYYVRMRVYNTYANKTENKRSAYSNVIKFTATQPKVAIRSSSVTKNSITIRMNASYSSRWMSGYEVQKKSGSGKKAKWKTVSKSSTTVYTDKKLKAFKTYSYRVRPYFYDYDTKKTTYGTWVYTEAMTGWSGNLNLKATTASKTSVKLKWNKIKGAKGYEVYRRVADSATTRTDKGIDNNYTAYKLIKNLGAGKKAYTDKGLTTGMSYTYVVKAYKKVGKKKVYIEGTDSVNLDFVLSLKSSYYTAKGKATINWNPVVGAKGYRIEKNDSVTGKYTLYKTIKNQKTASYTFPAATDVENGDTYRICAYNGNNISNYLSVTVNPILAAPAKVTAKVSGKKITISWSPVVGADYYRVYRTATPPDKYNSSLGTYTYPTSTEVGRYVPDEASVSGFRKCDLTEMNVTSVIDQPIVYMKNGIQQTYYAGPDTGVKYYYYVCAYKIKPQHGYIYDADEVSSQSAKYIVSGKSKPATAEIKEDKPDKPVISKISCKSKTVSVTIKGSVKADGYEIVRSTNKKKGFKVIGEAKGLSPVYKDKYNKKKNKLKKKKTYYYKVRSYTYNDDGSKVYSAYSTVKKVKFK